MAVSLANFAYPNMMVRFANVPYLLKTLRGGAARAPEVAGAAARREH